MNNMDAQNSIDYNKENRSVSEIKQKQVDDKGASSDIIKMNINGTLSQRECKRQNRLFPKNLIASNGPVYHEMDRYVDCAVTEKRIAVINAHHTHDQTRIHNFMSPLRVPKRLQSISQIGKKRKSPSESYENETKTKKRIKKKQKNAAEQFILQICKVGIDTSVPIYDSCTELVQKTERLLSQEGVQKAMFVRAIGVHYNSLDRFLAGKGQDQRCNGAYGPIYFFFEKLRIFHGQPKSKEREKNELEQAEGFVLESERERKQQTKDTIRYGLLC
jgi:hypothetical protein